MNTRELPSRETILKFAASVHRQKTHLTPIEKTGAPAVEEAGVRSQWTDITPAMAASWLKNNFGNRPVSEDTVTAYARDMINGVWRATHQGIAFNDGDQLIDGQHRLMAILQSGRTVRMMVTFGLPAKIEGSEMTTMDCVDRGRTRSVADQLKIQHGLKQGAQIAQVCSSLGHLCFGERLRRLSVGQTLDIYRAFQPGVDFVIEHRSKAAGLKSAGVLAAFAFVMSAEDCMVDYAGKAKEMFFHLTSPDQKKEFRAMTLLHAFLTGEQATLIVHSMNRGIAELVVWAIWQDVVGKGDYVKMETEPAAWLKAVEHFRSLQRERVAKIAGLFKLPATEKQVEPVAAKNAAISRTPVQPAPSAPASEPVADRKVRPTLDRILGCVETQTKLSRFILTGRGNDGEIDRARQLFTVLARGYGYTAEAVAAVLKKPAAVVAEWNLPASAWNGKLTKAVAVIKGKML